jgi:hypothetical protein
MAQESLRQGRLSNSGILVVMQDENKRLSRRLLFFCITALLINLTLLLWFAATTNVWDDETNGYYLSRLPVSKMMSALYNNYYEDPPFFNLLLSAWIRVAGFSPFLLRLLPFTFWLTAIIGMYLIGKKLAGAKAGLYVVIAACLVPYHMLYPIALRWYSLGASLAVWNLYFFLIIRDRVVFVSGPVADSGKKKFRDFFSLAIVGYGLTGAALWYTNYAALVYFFSHLVIVLLGSKHRRDLCFSLVIGWILVLLLFSPWLGVFIRQIGVTRAHHEPLSISKGTLDPIKIGLSNYVMFGGEFSTPFDWWISVPLSLVVLLSIVLVLRFFREVFVPFMVFLTVLAALIFTGTIWVKRMLLVSPFMAITAGLAMSGALGEKQYRLGWFAGVILCLFGIVFVGNMVHIFERKDWTFHRWLDPVKASVKKAENLWPDAVFFTNSNSVAFYRKDPFGIHLIEFDSVSDVYKSGKEIPKAFNVKPNLPDYYVRLRDEVLSAKQRAVYVHVAFANGLDSLAGLNRVTQNLTSIGFREDKRELVCKMSDLYGRYIKNLPTHRITILYLSKIDGR